jgi:hypothetical protein
MSFKTEIPILSEKMLLPSGGEAVARGTWEAGLHIAAAYPRTPSTEILEAIALYKETRTAFEYSASLFQLKHDPWKYTPSGTPKRRPKGYKTTIPI